MKKNLILLLILFILGGAVYLLYGGDKRNTLDANEFTEFAIEDTASVTKINIIDKVTGNVSLNRLKEGGWMIGNMHRAKSRSVEICLEAIKNIKIKGTIPKTKQRTIITNAAGAGTKIEIYTNYSDVPEKIWISAGNTSDHHGDYFILELPGKGISPEPFIVDMPMFAGYITARFHTVYNDWRFSGIFNHPKLDFRSISVEETAAPENSFRLEWDGEEAFKISNPISGNELKNINLANKIHLETFTLNLTKEQQDSVLARTPDWKISLTDLENKTKSLSMFYLPGNGEQLLADGTPSPYNLDIMYGTLGDGELFRVQYGFVFAPLLKPISYFGN
jgi:hypothetical protein